VRYQLDAAAVSAHWTPRTRGLMLASPSNPTGTSISTDTLQALLDSTRASGGFSVVDEIYQGLVYDHPPRSALALSSDVLVINSFSKYFSMTGWRLGWLALPETLVPAIERLSQNLFICASTVAQRAALGCFDPASLQIYETRRREFMRRRDFLVPALRRLGLDIPAEPDGAFYIYVDVGRFAADSWEFAFELLTETGVCVVPGRDFGTHTPQRYVRISYATAMDRLEEGIARMGRFLGNRTLRDS
jgi:aspartate/methionine/tyrosine aminotransferase